MDINYNIIKVEGHHCPSKSLLTINDQIVCFTNSKKGCNDIISYAYTGNEDCLENKKIKRRVNEILNRKVEYV